MHSQRYPTAAFVLATAVLAALPTSLLYAASHPPTKAANAPIRVPLDDGDTLTVAPANERFIDSRGMHWRMAGFDQPPTRFMLGLDCGRTGAAYVFVGTSVTHWTGANGLRIWTAACAVAGDRGAEIDAGAGVTA